MARVRESERPLNILWMVTDHQAYANRPACAHRFALQSKLARDGLRFTHAYTPLPVCSPARASMLTGLYPHAHGLTENDGRFGGRPGLDPSDWMIQAALRSAGYRCAWFGKWHVDNERSATDYGFEGFSLPGYGYPYATPAYRDYLDRIGCAPPIAEIEMPGESEHATGTRIALTEASDWFDYESGAAVLDQPAEAHEAFFLSQRAQDWLESLDQEPFFLRVDPWGPHPPYFSVAPFRDLLDPSTITLSPNIALDLDRRPEHHRRYRHYWHSTLGLDAEGWHRLVRRALEQVALVEAALAKLLDALERLGLSERTLVIFTADHGDAVGSNGGVANKGGLMVEETMRVPLLIKGPGVTAGESRHQLVSNADIAPTLLSLCGLPGAERLQSRSLVPLFDKDDPEWQDGLMTQHYGLHEPAVQRGYYADGWKLVVQADGFAELTDLQHDPNEMTNLAESSAHRERFEAMWAGLTTAMAATNDDDPRLSRILQGPRFGEV